MKFISSPAKLMNIENCTDFLKPSTPKFIENAEFIQSFLKEKSPKFLAELMEISPKLADENWERNQKWTANPTAKNSAPAMFAFTGEVYRGLDAKTLDKNAVKYLEKNFRILSGLYGLLKPSDKIMLYRLEMGRNFEFDSYKNLYEFWTEKVTEQLNIELGKNELLINLSSCEYGKVINRKNLKNRVIDFEFRQIQPDGKLKTIVVYTKHARGLILRFCAKNNVQKLDELKSFNYENYLLNEELSTDTNLVFTR